MNRNITPKVRLISKWLLLLLWCLTVETVHAQVGEHRNDFSIGFNGGYALSNIGFTPRVSQGLQGGMTGGISMRYVCEKYFSTICSVQAEVNVTQSGWKESILDASDNPVINPVTQMAEEYSRRINYVQVPFLAHLAWGKEKKGMQFFIQLGPQFGYYLSESTTKNFDFDQRNTADRINPTFAQDTMAVEHKFDYGISVGAGLEYSHPKLGHIQFDARYYYGLGNIYGDSKRDYFTKSNLGIITLKMAWLFDIVRTKRD